MNRRVKRLASHDVFLDGIPLGLYVVELDGDIVVNYFPLIRELPFTEFITRPIFITTDNNGQKRINN